MDDMSKPDSSREAVGKYVRESREASKLTQTELANRMSEALGGRFYQTTIGRIESGERSLSLTEAAVLSDVLNLRISNLAHLAAPPSIETIRMNHAHKIAEACNSIMNAVSSVVSARASVEELRSRFGSNPDDLSEHTEEFKALLKKLPEEEACFENARIELNEMAEEFHRRLGPWMFEADINGYLSTDEAPEV